MGTVKRFLRGLRDRRRDGARNGRDLERAVEESKLRRNPEGSIWRTGKGGSHQG